MGVLRWTPDELAAYRARLKPAAEAPAKRPKYRNTKTEVDGRMFDSKLEARRYSELRAMVEAGEIADLQCQVAFPIEIGGMRICRYVADFTYVRDGGRIVEDAKGVLTREYRLKKKLMAAVLGVEIVEYRAKASGSHRAPAARAKRALT